MKNTQDSTNYYHQLINQEGDMVEIYINFKSTKDFGLSQKCEQFGWTYVLTHE